ncbi:MAG: NAD(P)-dependent oxidoreductase [Acidobacteriota bacterium]|nr:NAD(P)-dependent oxidoreductase [Acidobacteriota bacterium]
MAQLGFLGLGIMGYPMARHLLEAGHEVALWSHTPAKARELAAQGKGTACATPKEVAQRADFIFYCVGNTAMARSVSTGKDGLLEGVRPGSVTADCSTVSPVESQEIAALFTAKGVHFLDAPCTGSKAGAEGGTLTFMVGGDEGAFDRAKPYFEAMGKLMYYCGPAGQGLKAKLTQNLVLANLMQAFAEGIVLAAKNGVPPALMLDILDNSAAKSGLLSAKAPFILKRDFRPNFSTKWMHKDIGLALESAKSLDLPLPLTALTQQMLQAAIAKGYGEDDFCSTIRVLEDLAGIEVKG